MSVAVVEPAGLLAEAHRLAEQMFRCSPIALRMTKLAVDAAPEAHPHIDPGIQAMLFEDDEKYRRMDEFLRRNDTSMERKSPQ
jgi:enoyl-CoA hydratase